MAWEGKIVMLADGSATLRYYYGILLKRLAFSVMVAESTEEALKVMQDAVPSLILIDGVLLQTGGSDFIAKVKNRNTLDAVPVIVLADREDAAKRTAFLGMGCVDFLVKQVEPGRLYRSIQAALEPKPREHIRLHMPIKVMLGDGTSKGGAERTEYLTTISEGGLYVRTLYPRPKSTSTPVMLFLKHRTIKATASVLYSQPLKGGVFREPGMGMKFVEISQEDRAFMRRFIKEQLTSDLVTG